MAKLAQPFKVLDKVPDRFAKAAIGFDFTDDISWFTSNWNLPGPVESGLTIFMASSDIPKLFITAEPGSILVGRQREFCRSWPNQQEVTVKGTHFIQEDSPTEIGQAVAAWLADINS